MSCTYLAYYESLILHIAPVLLNSGTPARGILLQSEHDQQRNTVQECDANEA